MKVRQCAPLLFFYKDTKIASHANTQNREMKIHCCCVCCHYYITYVSRYNEGEISYLYAAEDRTSDLATKTLHY